MDKETKIHEYAQALLEQDYLEFDTLEEELEAFNELQAVRDERDQLEQKLLGESQECVASYGSYPDKKTKQMYQAIRDEWERATKEGREMVIPLIKERTRLAMAKKCDRCETLYETPEENPPIFLLRDNCNTYMSFDLVDLCSGCRADLESWLKNESVTVTDKTYRNRNTIRNFIEEIIADHDRINTESKEIKKKVKWWDR